MFLGSVMLATSILAQAPAGMDFQSIIRDSKGDLITNQPIGIRTSILQDSVNGTAVYTETHQATTNNGGLITLTIGKGTTTDDFSAINWGKGAHYIKTEVDVTGGTDYILSATSQMLSVPYALYANTVKNIPKDIEDRIADVEDKVKPILGAFSVSSSMQIKFAPGNLKYNYTTKKYSFEEHQYDITLPNATSSTLQEIGCLTFADYSACNEFGCTNLDHGILCRNDLGGTWRTLSASEWMYVLNGRKNADKLYALAVINNRNGLLLLPDSWANTDDINIKTGTSSTWENNVLTLSTWSKLEQAGAVFLPSGSSGCYVTTWTEGGRNYPTYHYTNSSEFCYQTSSIMTYSNSLVGIAVKLSSNNIPTLNHSASIYTGHIDGSSSGSFLPVRVVEDL